MGRAGIEQLLYMMDRASEAGTAFGSWHSLLVNLADVQDDAWLWKPEGGERSIFEIVEHVGITRYAYDSFAFGDGSMSWDKEGSIPGIHPTTPRDEVVGWLRDGHQRLRSHLAGLEDDTELLALRADPWGTQQETRWLVAQVIQHDLYHAGELNHIRALRQRNDEWGNEP
jgi:hypothetical protein